jgi:hypothetical protein
MVSTGTIRTRSRAFVKTANEELFVPKGLKCKVLKTKKMMVVVGHGEEALKLPPFGKLDDGASGENEEPRMRRTRALAEMFAPLTS